MEKIDDACKFTSQLLEHGNTVEILSLKRVVGAQLLHLINNTPKPEVNTSIEFETDIKKFEAAVKVCIPTASGNFNTYTSYLISLLYSIVSYRYGTSQQPHATYKTFDSHTLITMRIVTAHYTSIQMRVQVAK